MRLNRIHDGAPVTLLAKIEGRNPAYSVKCRIGAAMVWDAERRGVLGPGKALVESNREYFRAMLNPSRKWESLRGAQN